jgi:predicted acyltransferase
LLTPMTKGKKSVILIAIGILSLILAGIWSYNFPINKNLWTSTFVLWSSGISLIVFGFCFWVIDVLNVTKWSLPFKIFGMNALFIFIFHVILLKSIAKIVFIAADGSTQGFHESVIQNLFGSLSANANLLYGLLFLLLNYLVAIFLYRRKIFIKI